MAVYGLQITVLSPGAGAYVHVGAYGGRTFCQHPPQRALLAVPGHGHGDIHVIYCWGMAHPHRIQYPLEGNPRYRRIRFFPDDHHPGAPVYDSDSRLILQTATEFTIKSQ